MGRKKSDSPTSFPWEKLFSESDNEFDQAISYCSSDHIGSDTVKRLLQQLSVVIIVVVK